jgi:hypothetical protein
MKKCLLIMIFVSLFASTAQAAVQWLHTQDIYIYDENNRRLNLSGPNVQYGGGQGLELADVQAIKALGFNAFRTHFYWGLAQPYDETSGGVDPTYFATVKDPLHHSLDELVQWAVQEDMYIILCLGWSESWAPPAWAFPGVTDEPQRCLTLISAGSKERTGIVNTWKYVADRYKDVPNIIFEFVNEPSVPPGSEAAAGSAYAGFNEEILSAIESVETQSHLKIVELLNNQPAWEEILDQAADIDKPNLIWATHRYSPMNEWNPAGPYYHNDFTWNGQPVAAGWGDGATYVAWRIVRVAEKIHSWHKPWINTEFSKVTTQAEWEKWFDAVLKVKTDYGITGWMVHCYCRNANDEPGWNIRNPTTQGLFMNVIRPYMIQFPDAVTATPTVTPAGGANREFSTPLVYPNPYKAHAGGGTGNIVFGNLGSARISLSIYTVAGRLVRKIEQDPQDGKISWNARGQDNENLPAGIYLYSLTSAAGQKAEGKLVILK